jgi:beta-lactamase superfamily II metal-dependent hydrolase
VLVTIPAHLPAQTDVIVPSDRVVTFVNVRQGPSIGTPALGALNKGEQAVLVLSVPNWYRIRLEDGTEGFVSKAWTTKVTPAPASPPMAGDVPFKVHFLDVGTGDAAIIDIGTAEIIIDGGDSVKVLRNYVQDRDIIDGPVELVVVTHGDTDHWKGLQRLMNFDGRGPDPPQVLEFWEPGYDRLCNAPSDRANYLAFIDHFQQLDGVQFRRPLAEFHVPAVETEQLQPFMLESIPDVTFTLLHSDATPESDNAECSYLINNASIVLRLQIGTTRILFTGDANGKERKAEDASQVGHVEKALLQLEKLVPGILMADVLKVPHHGSETASTKPFIKRIDPHFVIISASTRHDLPEDTVVRRYTSPERVILRTDRDRANNNDHIVCMKAVGVELKCKYVSGIH